MMAVTPEVTVAVAVKAVPRPVAEVMVEEQARARYDEGMAVSPPAVPMAHLPCDRATMMLMMVMQATESVNSLYGGGSRRRDARGAEQGDGEDGAGESYGHRLTLVFEDGAVAVASRVM